MVSKKEKMLEAINETKEQMSEVEKFVKDKGTFSFLYGKKLVAALKEKGLDDEAELLRNSLYEILMR